MIEKNMKQVIIEVKSGLIVRIDKPDDIELVVKDYDIYGENPDELKIDEDGNNYMETIY